MTETFAAGQWRVAWGPDRDGDDDEESESFGNSTDFVFQVRNSAGDVIADLYMEDPDDYHAGWESESFHDAGEQAMLVVVEIADSITAKTASWRWDGSAEELRDSEEVTQ